MKKIKLAVISLVALLGVTVLVPSYAMADVADEIKDGVNSVGGNEESEDLGDRVKDIVNVLLYVLGAIAVVMIIFGGIRYATSNGESAAITSAKNTILYAVVGLVVAILAYAIVNFVLEAFN